MSPRGTPRRCGGPSFRGPPTRALRKVRQTRFVLADRLPTPFDADDFVGTFDEWVREQGIRLYPAQEEAVLELVLGRHLVLSTPTGTGKSLVALAAHAIALGQGQRSYYTAPIKALVSEKFFALVDIFGAA